MIEMLPPDPECDCAGCFCERELRRLIEQVSAPVLAEVARLDALPYRPDRREYERLARALQERTAAVVDMFMRAHLYPGCMRPRLLVSGPDADRILAAGGDG